MSDSQFYTRRGDKGYTGLLGAERVPKYDLRPEAYGTADEAQAALGLARISGCTLRTGEILLTVQRDLYLLMAELAAAGEVDSPFEGTAIVSKKQAPDLIAGRWFVLIRTAGFPDGELRGALKKN